MSGVTSEVGVLMRGQTGSSFHTGIRVAYAIMVKVVNIGKSRMNY